MSWLRFCRPVDKWRVSDWGTMWNLQIRVSAPTLQHLLPNRNRSLLCMLLTFWTAAPISVLPTYIHHTCILIRETHTPSLHIHAFLKYYSTYLVRVLTNKTTSFFISNMGVLLFKFRQLKTFFLDMRYILKNSTRCRAFYSLE